MSLVGNKAPVFEAPAVVGGKTIVQEFSLAQFVDHKEVLLFFYPKDFTFVCPTELIAFQEQLEAFDTRGVVVVGCSTDTEETHLAWLDTPRNRGGIQGVTYPIVADVSKTIAANYGVLGGAWAYDDQDHIVFHGTPVAYRGTFFIDKRGVVRHETINDFSLGRNVNEMLRVVDMWHHVEKFGEVCPANWQKGQAAMKATPKGVADYLTMYEAHA
ncbi:MAG: peroxiredoxin [Amoebophilaceae bacterium]|jgi:peroxiredoxin (alkyl hydroperoxide reductase subunit C)|nr:peroxiredoxin [Amoebophilaceae bacterium]